MSKIEKEISKNLQKVAKNIDDQLEEIAGARMGFSLLVYTFPRASYIGNCNREESIEQLETLLELWKSGADDVPAHEVN